MGNLAERKRQRQEYLRKKGTQYTLATIAGIIFMPLLCITLLCTGMMVTQIEKLGFAVVLIGAGAGLCGALTCVCGLLVRSHMKQATNLPHVPPVSVQNKTLPAEEVLARASDEPPVAQQDVLLRAATSGQEEMGKELLRATGQVEKE